MLLVLLKKPSPELRLSPMTRLALLLYFSAVLTSTDCVLDDSYIWQSFTVCKYFLKGKEASEEEFHAVFPDFPNWETYKCKRFKGVM